MSVHDRSAPRVPADHGLACLGLLMQLAGNVFAAYGLLTAFAALFQGRPQGLVAFLVLFVGAGRSLAHRAAGTQLVYGDRPIGVPGPVEIAPDDEQRFGGIYRYLAIACVHTVLVVALVHASFPLTAGGLVAVACALLVWPAVLALVVTTPALRALARRMPSTEDKGFEAVAIVMTVLACCGLGIALFGLAVILDMPAAVIQQGPALMAIVLLVTMAVRSGLHLQAGISGLRETSIDRAVARATRYANFGVISTFCCGAALLLAVTMAQFDLVGIAFVSNVVWMLVAWPLIVRRFFSERQLDELLAGDGAARHHRAPDAGLTGLGWLLVGHTALMIVTLLLRVALGSELTMIDAIHDPVTVLATSAHALLPQLIVIALGGWAAVELLRMSARAKPVAVAWAVVAIALAVVRAWPELDGSVHLHYIPPYERLAGGIWLAGQVVLAVATLLLVLRRVAPSARARYRPGRSTIVT